MFLNYGCSLDSFFFFLFSALSVRFMTVSSPTHSCLQHLLETCKSKQVLQLHVWDP